MFLPIAAFLTDPFSYFFKGGIIFYVQAQVKNLFRKFLPVTVTVFAPGEFLYTLEQMFTIFLIASVTCTANPNDRKFSRQIIINKKIEQGRHQFATCQIAAATED